MLNHKKEPMKLSHYNFFVKNRKAQIGETTTWIIATIVLVIILIISIFTSVALSKIKSIKVNLKANSEESVDWINSKTKIAYSINPANRNRINLWIEEKENE